MTNPTDPNPFGFEDHVLADIADASGKMYDIFYDLLATYQFDFTLEEKTWMLNSIVKDITIANQQAEQNLDNHPS